MFALFIVQAIATYCRNYWASMAGHRLIFYLRYALYKHPERLSHSFFDRTTSGGVVWRFISHISMALNNRWLGDDQAVDGRCVAGLPNLAAVLSERAPGVDLAVDHSVLRRGDQDSVAANQGDQPRPAEVGEEFSGELQERVAGVSTVKSFAREADEARRFHRTRPKCTT